VNLLVVNAVLFVIFAASSHAVCLRAARRLQIVGGIILVILILPATLYSLYYFHWFDGWSWFYTLRSHRAANYYPATLGAVAGWAQPMISMRYIRFTLAVALAPFAIMPFLKPMLLPLNTASLHDRWIDGVCLQSTPSTCGPASVATVLAKRYGVRVSERDIAIAARSTATGTEIWYLAQYLRTRGYGVTFIVGMPPPAGSIAGTRSGGAGHFVAVLSCDAIGCQAADPLSGVLADSRRIDFTGFAMRIDRK